MRSILSAPSHEDLGHLAHHMSRLMHKVLQSGFSPGGHAALWAPAVDICETADHYEVIVELAGVRREEIEVYTENHCLIVSGWRGDPTPEDKICLHQMEIEEGPFRRSLRLPADADETAVSARYRDGFLYISIPKRAGGEARDEKVP